MKLAFRLIPLVLAVLLPAAAVRTAGAQEAPVAHPAGPAAPAAAPADVESIDAIIAALYDVISGPAGGRDWDRFRSLFAPGAVLSSMVPRPDGTTPLRVFGVEDFVQRSGAFLQENPFFERESGRGLQRFGNIANAMSAYESRRSPEDPEPFTRGINTITLVTDGTRWYLVSIAWDEVREGNPLPDWF
ncbi:MAG TPA: hypothetical protein VM737_02885 [Gemmatimonadota bacterium]|nr:hypothetical protein [Gemmatimonadota bacterium]